MGDTRTAVGRFDFKRLPDSCLGLLDYLQRALDETWERISPTPEPRRIIRHDRTTICDPSPDQIIRKKRAELERRKTCYAGFVTAFQQVSRPLQELFVGLKMPHLDFGATELPFFDFTVEPEAIRASQSAISDPLNEVELLFPRVAAHVLNAAFERAELPAGWLPGRATVRFNRDHAADIERYPTFPIRSSSDLTKWLMQWCLRCAKPNRHSLYERMPSSHWEFPKWRRLSDEDSYAPELEDFTRELRNCRRALLIWGITGSTNGEGDPPDLAVAEDRLVAMIDWLCTCEVSHGTFALTTTDQLDLRNRVGNEKLKRTKSKRKETGHRTNSEELFKAALRKHHEYETDGGVLNVEPASTRRIELLTNNCVSDTTASRLLTKHFGSVEEYRNACSSQEFWSKLVILLGDGLHAFGSFDATERDVEDQNDNDSDE